MISEGSLEGLFSMMRNQYGIRIVKDNENTAVNTAVVSFAAHAYDNDKTFTFNEKSNVDEIKNMCEMLCFYLDGIDYSHPCGTWLLTCRNGQQENQGHASVIMASMN